MGGGGDSGGSASDVVSAQRTDFGLCVVAEVLGGGCCSPRGHCDPLLTAVDSCTSLSGGELVSAVVVRAGGGSAAAAAVAADAGRVAVVGGVGERSAPPSEVGEAVLLVFATPSEVGGTVVVLLFCALPMSRSTTGADVTVSTPPSELAVVMAALLSTALPPPLWSTLAVGVVVVGGGVASSATVEVTGE